MSEKITWKNEIRKVSDLQPNPKNPRKANEKQVREITESLAKFQLCEPVIINLDNEMIGGHLRLSIFKKDGIEEIDVRVPDRQLSEKECEELMVRLNKNGADWDNELLAQMDENILMDGGFSQKELEKAFNLNPKIEPEVEFTTELLEAQNYVVLIFDNEMDWNVAKEKLQLKTVKSLRDKKGYEQKGIGRVINGMDIINRL